MTIYGMNYTMNYSFRTQPQPLRRPVITEVCTDCSIEKDVRSMYFLTEEKLCYNCFNEKYSYCSECGKYFLKSELITDSNSRTTCNKCYDKYYKPCSCCGEITHIHDIYVKDSTGYCKKCFNEKFVKCSHCGKYHLYSEITKTDGRNRPICNGCYDKYYKPCSCCGVTVSTQSYDTIEVQGKYYCRDCYKKEMYYCNGCGTYHLIKENNEIDSRGKRICNECRKNYEICPKCGKWVEKKYNYIIEDKHYCTDCFFEVSAIHHYKYRPDPIYYMKKNQVDLFGVELEIGEGGLSDKNAKRLLSIVNGDKHESKFYTKYDGSICDENRVCNGFEIVSHPATLKKHLEEFKWQEMMRKAVKLGYRSHTSGTCGLHVHINREAFGKTRTEQEYNITKLLYVTEVFWDQFVLFSRRTEDQLNTWCKRYCHTDINTILKVAEDKHDRYCTVNIRNASTIELRIFRGTLKYETFVATLQFCQCLLNFVRDVKLQDIQSTSFNDIVNWAKLYKYTELLQYMKARKLTN